MVQHVRTEFMQTPVVTRVYCTTCVLTTLAVQLQVVTPIQLLYHPDLVLHGEVWRLLTCFLFYGYLGFGFLFNMIFLYRFCRKLEETSFSGRTADFVVLFLFGSTLTLLVASTNYFRMLFLGEALTTMIVYIGCRRNPFVVYNFFGLFRFQAPYLPWILVLFSVLFGGSVAVDLVGIAIGHMYYFLEDVFPNKPGGFKIIRTPAFMKWIFDGTQADHGEPLEPEDRPGGYDWGEGVAPGGRDGPPANDNQQ
ncbi:Derlin-2 [Geodia barretti]|uniref:Derlin n=2 Tax=Geodia barretti TaxID=519541 RepID=A0AA35QW73_GEOBA|nr:Derlin-2 [Geodia barretti]